MSERATADYQAKLAARAQFVNNLTHAKALLEVAQKNVKDAEKALKKYEQENH